MTPATAFLIGMGVGALLATIAVCCIWHAARNAYDADADAERRQQALDHYEKNENPPLCRFGQGDYARDWPNN